MLKAMMMTLALAGLMLAQGPRAGVGQPPAPDALKAYLGLTDAQVQQLIDLRRTPPAAVTTLREQLQTKAAALREEMQKTNPDPAKVGQLIVEMKAIREQIRAEHLQVNDQAKALLTAEQKTKLAALEEAQKLAPAIRQATGLGLLAPPQGIGAGQGGRPGAGMGPGMGPGMGNGPMAGGRAARGFRGPIL